MREPWPEQVRRTLDLCRQNPARDVLSSLGWAQLREHCGELTVELDTLGHHPIALRLDRDYARLHGHLREATAAGWIGNRLLLADAIEQLASTLAALHRFRARIVAGRVVPVGTASGVEMAEAGAILAETDIAATPELAHAGVPKPDPYDTRKAVWFGKRIYLGNDGQVSRLFWLLAKPVGAAHSALEVQRAIDGVDLDRGRSPQEASKAEQRMRKAISKLPAALSAWPVKYTVEWPSVWRWITGIGVLVVAYFMLVYAGLRLLLCLSARTDITQPQDRMNEVLVPVATSADQRLKYDLDGNLTEAFVTGDINGDGNVDASDLGALLAAYGTCEGQQGYNPNANISPNNPGPQCIDVADLGVLLSVYGFQATGAIRAKFTWDAENRLVGWEPLLFVSGAKKVEFGYDYQEGRVRV